MEIDMLARRWVNEFVYNGHETPARTVGPHALETMPEIMEVVRDCHKLILGRVEPLDPWLMQQIYYVLEAISNDEDNIGRAISTAAANGPDKDPEALEAWVNSHVIYQSYTTKITEAWSSARPDCIQAAQARVIGELGNVLYSNLCTWAGLLEANGEG